MVRGSRPARWTTALALSCALAASARTPPAAVADEHDCTYDQQDQQRVVREVARRYPGGRVEAKERRITWPLPSGGSVVFVYGGCDHLGSVVTRTEARTAALPQARVFAVATELAGKYWDKAVAKDLRTGLAKRAFHTETVDGRRYYHVRHESLAQLYVEYEFSNGASRVTIAWSRTF